MSSNGSNGNGNGNARAGTYARFGEPSLSDMVGMCVEVYESARDAERVYTTKDGDEHIVAQPERANQLKAVELMAKLLGYLGSDGGKVDVEQLRRQLKAHGYELVARART